MKQGDVVLVPFPFSDLSSSKTRPALIVSSKKLKGDDIILCAITSQKRGIAEVVLSKDDLSKGKLPVTSYVKLGKIVSLNKSIVQRVVASISKEKKFEVLKKLKALF